jgi:putative thioredoxin
MSAVRRSFRREIDVIDANPTNFQAEVLEASHDLPVMVDFWAPWCAPCAVLGPLLEKLERESAGGFKLVKVDADDNPGLMTAWGVRSLPTVVLFRAGRPVDRFVGALPESRIRAFVARLAPPPGQDLLVQAGALLAHRDWPRAAEVLRTVLALNPALDAARAHYVRTMLRLRQPGPARLAFEPLRGRASADLKLAALAMLLEAVEASQTLEDEAPLRAALERDPGDSAAWLALARWRMAHERWQPAMDALLELVRRDRAYGNDAGRRGMLAAFELCEDEALVRDYRRRLSAGLY